MLHPHQTLQTSDSRLEVSSDRDHARLSLQQQSDLRGGFLATVALPQAKQAEAEAHQVGEVARRVVLITRFATTSR